jgi:uncharacterized phage protein (TIGR01671 family)
MRTLNFRVWDKKNRKMIYPTIIWNYTEESVNYMFPIFSGIKYDDIDDVSEMMQFTGIIDKNGSGIYEGDIVKWKEYKNEYPLVLTEENKIIKTKVVEFNIGEIWQGYQLDKNMEVIGNIYENPNLLSEGREI